MRKLKYFLVITSLATTLIACSPNKTTPPDISTNNITLKEGIIGNSLESVKATVKDTYDGDTIEAITENGEVIKVRYLLIDTPESVGSRAPMAYGKESSDFNKKLVEGKEVTLIYDKGDKTDKYGRHLCYVMLDNKLVQELILEEGYGIIQYVNPPNTTFLSYLKEFEKSARVAHKNVWSIPNYATASGYNNEAVEGQIFQDQLTGDAINGSGEVAKEVIETYIEKELGGVAGEVYDHFLEDEVEDQIDEGVKKVLEIFK
ncbi:MULTISPECIES: thermonuclease family protein [Metabacillus]|uniref:thermonuclease family protein n=1 Tax=Metabacillus TaxID=2675233 RepID=UPI000C80107D|nr:MULTISPECIES: thermonuclease family protein [Metabacillus]MCM3443992.1 thermonuclease family protein [Metabacillus halosaccharovorans]PMC34957.1 hypothetical protein CJ195_20835 [Bacillus sp. UMB0899]